MTNGCEADKSYDMADYVVTPANVIASSQKQITDGVAGVAITQGQGLYQATDGTLHLCSATGAAPINVLKGIALCAALPNQPVQYVRVDPLFQPGFPVAAGDEVIVSSNPGNFCPDSDKATGWFVTQVGVGIGSNQIKMQINASGVAR